MTQLQRYLVEEIAEDHRDGILTRREAMRRLGLMGVTGAAATALLVREPSGATAAPGAEGQAADGANEATWAPVPTQEISFAGPAGPLLAAWAPAADPVGGLLVIHENRGLNDHIRSVAGRYAASGYSALALDLLSRHGGTGAFPDDAARSAALATIAPEDFVADMQAAVGELQNRVPKRKVAATGFCFGGGMVWLLLTSGDRRLAAGAPFYGPFPEGGSFGKSKAAVLGVYGGLDDRVNATRAEAQAALEAAKLKYQLLTFTDAGHAFFNDTGTRYDVAAAAEAYRRVLLWLERYVAKG